MLILLRDDMISSLARHSLVAVLLAVIVEELGIPLSIPMDLMIAYVGADRPPSHLALVLALLTLSSAIGASGLYSIIQRDGRPLVNRFGRYVHLGPEQLARSEALLARSGWGGIALSRALPGLRYATVVARGLFGILYLRFVTAHLVGSSAYIAVFLALGAIFGPQILERIHPPTLALRLLKLLPLALGLPLLMTWWGSRILPRRPAEPSRRLATVAVLLGGFAATWSASTTVADLLRRPRAFSVP